MSNLTEAPVAELLRLINGYQLSQAIGVAARLGLADRVADEPIPAEVLAPQVEVDPEALYRLMRALATNGIFHETHDRRFTATPLSRLLRSDEPTSLRGWAAFIASDLHWSSWGDLAGSVRTGVDTFRRRYAMNVWDVRARDPEAVAGFSAAMAAVAGGVVREVTAAYDFGRFRRIVDIGGADGTLLAGILIAYPTPTGIVFDLPHVVEAAYKTLEDAGLKGRCEVVGGSYFGDIPGGADAYLLKSVLHDCTDDDSVAILKNVGQAVAPAGRVILIEPVIGAPNEDRASALSDLNMLANTGGRERRRDEWEQLLAGGGFELLSLTPTSGRFKVLEAAPA